MVDQEMLESLDGDRSPTGAPPTSVAEKPRHASEVWTYVCRVAQRPRAWIAAYLMTALPALGLALLTTLAVLPLARYPAFRQAIETRSLDFLLDLATLDRGETWLTPLGALALLLIPPVGITVRLMGVWLEGGTLADYAAPIKLSWRAFRAAGWHWFGVFLALDLIGVVLLLLIGGIALLAALWVYGPFPTLVGGIAGIGLLLAGLCATWIEMARAAALVHHERHIFRALQGAVRAMVRQWRALAVWVGVSWLLGGALFFIPRWLTHLLPLSGWFFTLVVQQTCIIARLGMRLARRAGQVGLLAD
ncbi:MAG TPA: hypothetical protein PLH19_05840 [Anaerolineae bacterium]|nr:hypothetical protein [Anaerolineae bacterium]HQH38042.1 hypothetical protein [Anaerolineae bacterium]